MSVNVLYEMNRMTSRAQINDMDKCTIFSVYPKDIEEKKITLMPFMYQIPAGTPEKPSRVVIGPASWWRDVDPEQPLIEIPVSSVVVAQSVVLDYTKSIYGYTAGKRCPGIFFLTGDVSVEQLKSTTHIHRLKKAIEEQKAWYNFLCEAADALWARSNGNPLAIMEDMKLAATALGYSREWMKNQVQATLIRCINCGELRNPEFPTCKHCHAIIDKELAKKLGLVA